jgi:DNA-binding NarL/FixJ family response regulator
MPRARVLFADDNQDTLLLLGDLLRERFDVIAEVTDGDALVEAAERLAPDLIITDIMMPGMDGITAADAILRRDPKARIVFVTAYQDAILVDRAMATGAFGYVLKLSAGDELLPAAYAALRGARFVSAAIARHPVTEGY